jgi:hypothetical protein
MFEGLKDVCGEVGCRDKCCACVGSTTEPTVLVSVADGMVRKEQRMIFIARRHVYQIVKAVCNSPPFIFIIPSCGLPYGCTSLGSAS